MGTVIDDVISERISFLQEQIKPQNKPAINDTFQLQINILQSADLEKLDRSILMRKEHLKKSKDTRETDRLFVELEALEWLQKKLAAV
jgi:hypothetical protein